MDNIDFSDSWEQYLSHFGLSTFEDFYHYDGDFIIGKNSRRSVHTFAFGEANERKVFFMKKFHKPHLKDTIKAMYNYGLLTSQARIEWENAQYLLKNGIDTYKPVCLGERTHIGIESESFFITEELTSTCLLDFVIEGWHSLGHPVQEKIIIGIGNLVRRIHELNVSFPDLYLWHIFIHRNSLAADCQFSIIDLHRMTQGVRSSRRKIKELGRLYWSMSTKYFSDKHKALLINTYIDGNSDLNEAALIKTIRKCSEDLKRKRTLKNYYRTTDPTKKRHDIHNS